MVESLDAVFHALSSEPRRDMLGVLASGERTVGDLAQPFGISLAAISKH
jgi:DNA-binding transcriptional ArsR family regulator